MATVVTAVYPGGRTAKETLTPEEEATMERSFSENFDPVTLERLSIKRHREASERKSAGLSQAGKPDPSS